MTAPALFISFVMAARCGTFDLQRFYVYFSMVIWIFLFIHYWYAWKHVRSIRKNSFSDFWLNDKEAELVEKTYGDSRSLDEYYATLPLARRRMATINHGFLGALRPAMLAWTLTATISKLFLSQPLQAMMISATGAGLYRGVVTATLANLAALAVGLPLYMKYRNRFDRELPLPPLVTWANLKLYNSSSPPSAQ